MLGPRGYIQSNLQVTFCISLQLKMRTVYYSFSCMLVHVPGAGAGLAFKNDMLAPTHPSTWAVTGMMETAAHLQRWLDLSKATTTLTLSSVIQQALPLVATSVTASLVEHGNMVNMVNMG